MNTKVLQKEIIANRLRRGWASANDLSKTTEGLAEELGEFTKARRHKNREEMIDALGDIIVWAMGGLEILGVDTGEVVEEIVERNSNRVYDDHY